MDYASVNDVIALFRALTPQEEERTEALIPIICNSLRMEAKKVGKDLDEMVEADSDLAGVAKSVTVDIVARTLNTATTGEPMSQVTQSALGYSLSGTYLVPGGGLFIKKSELARLGLRRQRFGTVELWSSEA
jgi:hypothetical protein